MLPTLLLTSSILVAGMMGGHAGGVGPINGNTEYFTSPRVGASTREEVVRMWGQPATEKVEKDQIICTWPRGRKTVILTFSTRLGCLVDRKVVKS